MNSNSTLESAADAERQPFTITSSKKRGFTILSVAGEIDLLTADRLRRTIKSTFRAGTDNLLIDLTKTTFLASVGLNVLEQAREEAESSGGLFAVVANRASTTRPIVVLRLEKKLGLRKTVSEVIAAWSRPDVRWPEPSPLTSWWTQVMSSPETTGQPSPDLSDH